MHGSADASRLAELSTSRYVAQRAISRALGCGGLDVAHDRAACVQARELREASQCDCSCSGVITSKAIDGMHQSDGSSEGGAKGGACAPHRCCDQEAALVLSDAAATRREPLPSCCA
jgi:hypothetical protein